MNNKSSVNQSYIQGKIWQCNCMRHSYNIKHNEESDCLRCKARWDTGQDILLRDFERYRFVFVSQEDNVRIVEYGRIVELQEERVVASINNRLKEFSYRQVLDISTLVS